MMSQPLSEMLRNTIALIICYLFFASTLNAQPVPLWRSHSHNDYEQERPLLEALERGLGSFEVDIHLVNGQLLVAHDPEDVDERKTLERMYLSPLRVHIEENNGTVYGKKGSVVLLIDIKSDGEETYKQLREALKKYADILTKFSGDLIDEGPVTAIISGNRPRAMMMAEGTRWAAYDGRLEDLGQPDPTSVSFMPLVSSNWMHIARWYGAGTFPDKARAKLIETVKQAHAEGRKIRFWATSDNPAVWEELYNAGVDYLNADDLEKVQAFLLSKQ